MPAQEPLHQQMILTKTTCLDQAKVLLLLLLTPVTDPRTNMEMKRRCADLLKIVRLQGRVV
uniref:Uncharacterized protein n=1 Tax=Arundo donax TaxID=35708 RepID=A0A0A9GDW8_ARUDO